MPRASSGRVSGGLAKQPTGGPGGPVEKTISVTFDGGGIELSTGLKGVGPVLEDGTLTGWTLFADAVGDMVVDVWVNNLGDDDPTDQDSVTGEAPPLLMMERQAEDTILNGWNKTLVKGGTIGFHIDSVIGIEKALLVLIYLPD